MQSTELFYHFKAKMEAADKSNSTQLGNKDAVRRNAYSEIVEALKDFPALESQLTSAREQIENLTRQRDRYKAGLEVYADKSRWGRVGDWDARNVFGIVNTVQGVRPTVHGYDLATEILSKTEGEDEQ